MDISQLLERAASPAAISACLSSWEGASCCFKGKWSLFPLLEWKEWKIPRAFSLSEEGPQLPILQGGSSSYSLGEEPTRTFCYIVLLWFDLMVTEKEKWKGKKRVNTDGAIEELTPTFKHPNKLSELNKPLFMTIMSQILEKHISRYIYASIKM